MYGYSKVLVTGGAGFIGSHVVDRLLTEETEVVVLDNLSTGRLENVKQHIGKENFRFIRGDIRDCDLVRELVRDADAVIHQAALISVPESIKDPAATNDVNVNGTLNLLKAAADSDVKCFVYASSSAVYGDVESLPVKENYLPRPTSPYGASKMAAENYVRVFHETFGLKTICLRYFNVYGPRQAYNDYSGVITQFMNRLTNNRPLVVFGDGEQTRDFVYVRDVVEANLLALKNRQTSEATLNIGSGVATTVNQLATALLEITGKTQLKLAHSEPRRGDIRHSVADISKAIAALQYGPKVSLRDGLKELMKSYSI